MSKTVASNIQPPYQHLQQAAMNATMLQDGQFSNNSTPDYLQSQQQPPLQKYQHRMSSRTSSSTGKQQHQSIQHQQQQFIPQFSQQYAQQPQFATPQIMGMQMPIMNMNCPPGIYHPQQMAIRQQQMQIMGQRRLPSLAGSMQQAANDFQSHPYAVFGDMPAGFGAYGDLQQGPASDEMQQIDLPINGAKMKKPEPAPDGIGIIDISSVNSNQKPSVVPTQRDAKSTKARRYVCHCGRAFTTSGHLARHNRIHTGEKNFECEICHSRFSRKDNCMQHYRTHLNSQNSAKNGVITIQSKSSSNRTSSSPAILVPGIRQLSSTGSDEQQKVNNENRNQQLQQQQQQQQQLQQQHQQRQQQQMQPQQHQQSMPAMMQNASQIMADGNMPMSAMYHFNMIGDYGNMLGGYPGSSYSNQGMPMPVAPHQGHDIQSRMFMQQQNQPSALHLRRQHPKRSQGMSYGEIDENQNPGFMQHGPHNEQDSPSGISSKQISELLDVKQPHMKQNKAKSGRNNLKGNSKIVKEDSNDLPDDENTPNSAHSDGSGCGLDQLAKVITVQR